MQFKMTENEVIYTYEHIILGVQAAAIDRAYKIVSCFAKQTKNSEMQNYLTYLLRFYKDATTTHIYRQFHGRCFLEWASGNLPPDHTFHVQLQSEIRAKEWMQGECSTTCWCKPEEVARLAVQRTFFNAIAGNMTVVLTEMLRHSITLKHVNFAYKKKTAAFVAASLGHTATLKLLIDHGADLSRRSGADHLTPLMIACSNHKNDVVALILEDLQGDAAVVSMLDANGKTAYDHATAAGNKYAAGLICNHLLLLKKQEIQEESDKFQQQLQERLDQQRQNFMESLQICQGLQLHVADETQSPTKKRFKRVGGAKLKIKAAMSQRMSQSLDEVQEVPEEHDEQIEHDTATVI